MAIEIIELSAKHRTLLDRLAELIPDLDTEQPESLQRIFGLGLIALTMQVTSKAREEEQDQLVAELGALARDMVQEEGYPDLFTRLSSTLKRASVGDPGCGDGGVVRGAGPCPGPQPCSAAAIACNLPVQRPGWTQPDPSIRCDRP